MKVFQVVGYSNSGKTSLVSQLIKELNSRGYRVGSAKSIGCGRGCAHSSTCGHHHGSDHGFSIDSPGSDTKAHTEAGSGLTTSWAKGETALIYNRQLDLWELIAKVDADYLVIEGGKSLNLPRILSVEDQKQIGDLKNGLTLAISGKLADHMDSYQGLPLYRTYEDIGALVDLLERVLPSTIGHQDHLGCDLCGMACKDLLDLILKGDREPEDCLRMYPCINSDLDPKDKELIGKALLYSDKFYKSLDIKLY